jgi:hypothetical protein
MRRAKSEYKNGLNLPNDYLPTEIHHTFLISGHSYLACDRDFGVIEKEKKVSQS